MAAHSPTQPVLPSVMPYQPPSGQDAWLREIAAAINQTSAWAENAVLEGVPGPPGPTGATGATGPAGPPGDSGGAYGPVWVTEWWPSDGTAITPAEVAEVQAYMASIASATGNIIPVTARKLYFPGGRYYTPTFQFLTTWGTSATLGGDGPVTVLQGFGLKIIHNKVDISNLEFRITSTPGARPTGTIALNYFGGLRSGHVDNIYIVGYDIGVFRSGFMSFEALSKVSINQCRDGMVIRTSNSFQAHQCNISDNDDYGVLCLAAGEIKFSNSTIRGSPKANLALLGSRRHGVVESYWHEMTITGADPINIPILGVNNVGGFAQLVIGTEINVTAIEDRGSIMTEYMYYTDAGVREIFASDLVNVGTDPSGQLDSLKVGAVELLSAPVPFNTTHRLTATNIVAAVNAGTGTHGFTATDASSNFYINGPLSTLGQPVTTIVSGGTMTVKGQAHVAFICASPHGFTQGQWSQFDTLPYKGCEPVRYVESPTVFIWLMPEYAGTAVGKAWAPHWYTENTNAGVIASIAYNEALAEITAVGNVTLTVATPYADMPALGSDAVLTCGGNDLYIDCLDNQFGGVNDQFFIGGNINRTFIASGMNIMFKGVRLKNQIIVVPRAHRNLEPRGIMFEIPSRGRADDATSMVRVGGATQGWGAQGFNLNSDNDESYWYVQVPSRDLPPINGIPQLNETRWYRNRIEQRVGDQVIATYQSELALFQAGEFYHPSATNVNRLRIQDGPAGTGPLVSPIGPDTDIDMRLLPKGTGRLRFGTNTAHADAAITGYVEIRTAAGAIVKLATIA